MKKYDFTLLERVQKENRELIYFFILNSYFYILHFRFIFPAGQGFATSLTPVTMTE